MHSTLVNTLTTCEWLVRPPLIAMTDATRAGTVYGVLLNFREARAALADQLDQPPYRAPPRAPILYIKTANTLASDGATVCVPGDATWLRTGGALGIEFGARTQRVTARAALDGVAGYRIVNDFSVPHDSYYRPPVRYNCRDGYCPMGPLHDHAALADPDDVTIDVLINGSLARRDRTAGMIRSVPCLIATISAFMTFHPGDLLLLANTVQAPLVRDGDEVSVSIDGLGCLRNRVTQAPREVA